MLARYCAKADGNVETTYKKERKQIGAMGQMSQSSETRQFSSMIKREVAP
jgi:hypothetical protein